MEFEDVSEVIEREAKRVAVAFGLQKYKVESRGEEDGFKLFFTDKIDLEVSVYEGTIDMVCMYVRPPGSPEGYFCGLYYISDEWSVVWNARDACDLMVRGLYCLGLEDEKSTSELPPLTAHEKLELRLSMPREFRPKTWLDEASEQRSWQEKPAQEG